MNSAGPYCDFSPPNFQASRVFRMSPGEVQRLPHPPLQWSRQKCSLHRCCRSPPLTDTSLFASSLTDALKIWLSHWWWVPPSHLGFGVIPNEWWVSKVRQAGLSAMGFPLRWYARSLGTKCDATCCFWAPLRADWPYLRCWTVCHWLFRWIQCFVFLCCRSLRGTFAYLVLLTVWCPLESDSR